MIVMKNIYVIAQFELNDKNLLDDWKIMSDNITKELKHVDGFISRDSAIDENGKVYCILKWENLEKRTAFAKTMEEDSFKEKMADFSRIANMETMKMETYTVL